jgi:iron complex transport system substrate-binding protein
MIRFAVVLAAMLPISAAAETFPDAKSIVSIGGPVTEIIFALGQQHRIVARDTTSTYPQAANDLPDVGYMRRLSAEGVLSVAPDLIITRDTAGPPEVMEQLEAAAVPIVEVHDGFDQASVIAAIHTVGDALGKSDAAAALADTVTNDFAKLGVKRGKIETPLRVMFILSNQAGRLNVAGRETGADGLIALAGGVNVMGTAFEGYKILNDEAVISAAPDVILMMGNTEDHVGKAHEVLSLHSLSQTPAGQNGEFVTIAGAALGFGPRTAALASSVFDDLYPALAQE